MSKCPRCGGSGRTYSDANDEFYPCGQCKGEGVDFKALAKELADSILSLAASSGIPDSFLAMDSRIRLANETLEALQTTERTPNEL